MAVNRLGLGLLIGAAVGATVALLYAPKSGKETREIIRTRVAGARHGFGERISGEECSPSDAK